MDHTQIYRMSSEMPQEFFDNGGRSMISAGTTYTDRQIRPAFSDIKRDEEVYELFNLFYVSLRCLVPEHIVRHFFVGSPERL